MSRWEDEDGIDGPADRAWRAAMKDDARELAAKRPHCGKVGPATFGGIGTMVCTAKAGHVGPCYAAEQRRKRDRLVCNECTFMNCREPGIWRDEDNGRLYCGAHVIYVAPTASDDAYEARLNEREARREKAERER